MVDRTKTDMVQWYHATLLSPVKPTLLQETKKGYFATWPRLKIYLINKHLPPSMVTSKFHMHKIRKKINSTKQQEPMIQEGPLMIPLAQHTNIVFAKIINHKRQIATDLT